MKEILTASYIIILDTIMRSASSIFILVIVACFWIIIPARMARKRGRSEFGWVVLAWCISPLCALILLAILGDKNK